MRVPVLAYSFLLKEGSTGRGARALQRQEQRDPSLFPVGEAGGGGACEAMGVPPRAPGLFQEAEELGNVQADLCLKPGERPFQRPRGQASQSWALSLCSPQPHTLASPLPRLLGSCQSPPGTPEPHRGPKDPSPPSITPRPSCPQPPICQYKAIRLGV